MRPAEAPRARHEVRMLVAGRRSRAIHERPVTALPSLLRAGDVLVVNDAATLPASLETCDGELELRLTGPVLNGRARAVAFGPGDWRMRTEDRRHVPALHRRQRLTFRGGLEAHVDSVEGREVMLHFDHPEPCLTARLYLAGRPIQYSYLSGALELWDVQTAYAGRPWASEAPSAGFSLSFELLRALRNSGVEVARLTHAAGISSTGDPQLDSKLPLPERFDLPGETVDAVSEARRRGGRVIAVGTSVVRALEGAFQLGGDALRSGSGVTSLRINDRHSLQLVEGLLTGVHEPHTSHSDLLSAFIDQELRAHLAAEAERRGFLVHEFGDTCLLLPD